MSRPLDAWEESHLASMITASVREDEDLDFKSQLYGNTDSEKRELAGDLAALANHRGGVIVIGLNERQAQVTERFQRLLTLIGSIILVPGLIVGIFGRTWPIAGRAPGGFWAMLLFMVGGAIASYAIIRTIEDGLWAESGVWMRSKLGTTGGLIVSVLAASVLCLAAISILVF